MKARYQVRRFDLKMTSEQSRLEQFLNSVEGEIVAIIPTVTLAVPSAHRVDFVLVVERAA